MLSPMEQSVGEGDGVQPWGGSAVLAVPDEFLRFCSVCQEWHRFVARFEVADGRLGDCQGCGATFVVPFSRAVTEEA